MGVRSFEVDGLPAQRDATVMAIAMHARRGIVGREWEPCGVEDYHALDVAGLVMASLKRYGPPWRGLDWKSSLAEGEVGLRRLTFQVA